MLKNLVTLPFKSGLHPHIVISWINKPPPSPPPTTWLNRFEPFSWWPIRALVNKQFGICNLHNFRSYSIDRASRKVSNLNYLNYSSWDSNPITVWLCSSLHLPWLILYTPRRWGKRAIIFTLKSKFKKPIERVKSTQKRPLSKQN